LPVFGKDRRRWCPWATFLSQRDHHPHTDESQPLCRPADGLVL